MFGERSQGSIHALIIVFIVSTLIFLSSFISLTHHDIYHPTEHHYKNSREHMLEQSRKQFISKVSPPTESVVEPTKTEIKASTKSKEPSYENKSKKTANKKHPDNHPNIQSKIKKDEKKHPKAANDKKDDHSHSSHEPNKKHVTPKQNPTSDSSAIAALTVIQKQPRTLRFPSKCHVNPHIHYWDEFLETNISPLRAYHGLSVPYEQQKFIVFQPDLGGWNNIRMALEVVILLAKVTGRILVLPPNAVLYLLSMNKKWGENKSGMKDYFDFHRLCAEYGLETMAMEDFLTHIAKEGLLSVPLPDNNTKILRKELWDYLEHACYCQPWSPGKLYLGMNITTFTTVEEYLQAKSTHPSESWIGDFTTTDPAWLEEFSLGHKRDLLPYATATLHAQRAIFFPGHEANRLLTHYYSYLFFPTHAADHQAKRFMRDRLRYHDEIFCVGSQLIERLLTLQSLPGKVSITKEFPANSLSYTTLQELAIQFPPKYIAFHIRRGDFQQKHTRLPAEEIVKLTATLVPDRASRIAYIATDEKNRSFFAPFLAEYKAVYFLEDISLPEEMSQINQNYVGMIEQVICAAAYTFIGTPLSTFTAYITRMRGYLNRTIELPMYDDITKDDVYYLNKAGIYDRTYYFMKHQMHQLQTKPKVHFPLWIRDFVDVFQGIDEE